MVRAKCSMVRARCSRLLVALGVFLTLGQVVARAQTMPSAPTPAETPPAFPAAALLPPAIGSLPDSLIPPGEQFFDPRFNPPPGWFTNLEMGLVHLHLSSGLKGDVPIAGAVDRVQLPAADLPFNVTPRIGVGYRFPVMGEITLSYQSIVSTGNALLPGFDALGAGSLSSRLNMNIADLDYSGSEISLGHWVDMKWRAGVRFANVFFDSHAVGSILEQRANNIFNGAGPRAGLDLWKALPPPGLALFGRIEGDFMVGRVEQRFEETTRLPGGASVSGVGGPPPAAFTNTGTPLVLNIEAGLGYTPPNWGRWVRLSAVYQFQQWWNLGIPLESDGQLTIHGVFFRAEIKY
jgi:hypothetical protein